VHLPLGCSSIFSYERFIDAMMASASVPVVMEATLIGKDVCYDGGVRDLLPFSNAIKLGAQGIVSIFLDPRSISFPKRSCPENRQGLAEDIEYPRGWSG
jgi:predicted acylesterase/phospholipase RssA